jgi:NAD(P)-dependent dehydrogenase (short-subunit alcohol dehydrogenase family)
MSKTILIAGYGPGISDAVARKFGAEGFAVALAARNEARLTAGARALEGLGVAKAAQHKLVRLLSERLRDDGIFVGEVTVLGMVKGSAYDATNQGAIEPSAVADAFWKPYTERKTLVTKVG